MQSGSGDNFEDDDYSADDFYQATVADGWVEDLARAKDWLIHPQTKQVAVFGQITEEMAKASGLKALPIRMANGADKGTGNGFGVRHIHYQHGDEIIRHGYTSVQDFVHHTLESIEELLIQDSGRSVAIRLAEKNESYSRIVILELSRCETCYSVVTAYPRPKWRKMKGRLVWRKKTR